MEDRGDSSLTKSFLFLFIIGFFIIFVGIAFIAAAAMFSGEQVNFGALIFIGPFPIVIGAGPEAVWMILFAVVLAVLSIVIFLVFYKRRM